MVLLITSSRARKPARSSRSRSCARRSRSYPITRDRNRARSAGGVADRIASSFWPVK